MYVEIRQYIVKKNKTCHSEVSKLRTFSIKQRSGSRMKLSCLNSFQKKMQCRINFIRFINLTLLVMDHIVRT